MKPRFRPTPSTMSDWLRKQRDPEAFEEVSRDELLRREEEEWGEAFDRNE